MQPKKLPFSLNNFQKKMYEHLIEKKWKCYHETKDCLGKYRGNDYDAISPASFMCDCPPMLSHKVLSLGVLSLRNR